MKKLTLPNSNCSKSLRERDRSAAGQGKEKTRETTDGVGRRGEETSGNGQGGEERIESSNRGFAHEELDSVSRSFAVDKKNSFSSIQFFSCSSTSVITHVQFRSS